MKFPDIKSYIDIEGRTRYQLMKDYEYWGYDGQGEKFKLIVRSGVGYKGVHILGRPFFMDWFVPRGLFEPAALIQSKWYRGQGLWGSNETFFYWAEELNQWVPARGDWTRKQVDNLFLKIMEQSGVEKWRRRALYAVVRLFNFSW